MSEALLDIPEIDFNLLEGLLRGLRPDPLLTVSEWADSRRKLPATSAEPGAFRTSRTPYNREIGERLSVQDKAQRVVYKKSSQIGATELGNNWCGYTMDVSPCGMLYIMPTADLMKTTSKTRIQPMIDATPSLDDKVVSQNNRAGGNTMMSKEFLGGFLNMIGANSPVGLSSIAVKRVYCDETDRFPINVGDEGDVIALAETRTISFGDTKKIFLTSTPTMKGQSIIDFEFQKTGQRYYNVPCPHCSVLIVLKFEQLKYEVGKYNEVYYECQECGDKIYERHKTKMLEHGEWIASCPDLEDGITYGYHINALYSPVGWYSWAQMVREYEKAKEDVNKMVVFTNTKLGEVYEADGDAPEWQNLYNKREPYARNQPHEDVIFLTAGVDVQRNRLEVEIVGWGKGKQNWSIDFRVFVGKTDNINDDCYRQLSELLAETFTRTDGAVLQIKQMAIDSGFNTSTVYEFSRKHLGIVIPTKGKADLMQMVSAPKAVETTKSGKKINGVKVWLVGVDMIKTELYGWLTLQRLDDEPYPNGYCHFPEYDSNFFKGLTAEKVVQTRNKKGYIVNQWLKHFERNEPLDCRVYARAAAHVFGIDRWTEKTWTDFENQIKDTIQVEVKPSPKKKKPDNDFWSRR